MVCSHCTGRLASKHAATALGQDAATRASIHCSACMRVRLITAVALLECWQLPLAAHPATERMQAEIYSCLVVAVIVLFNERSVLSLSLLAFPPFVNLVSIALLCCLHTASSCSK